MPENEHAHAGLSAQQWPPAARCASSMMSAKVRGTAPCAWSRVSYMVSSFRFGGGMGSRPRPAHSRLGGAAGPVRLGDRPVSFLGGQPLAIRRPVGETGPRHGRPACTARSPAPQRSCECRNRVTPYRGTYEVYRRCIGGRRQVDGQCEIPAARAGRCRRAAGTRWLLSRRLAGEWLGHEGLYLCGRDHRYRGMFDRCLLVCIGTARYHLTLDGRG